MTAQRGRVPIRGCGKQADDVEGDVLGNKLADRMTDEHVCEFNPLPQVLPDFFLWRARTFDEITADLNVRTIDDRNTGTMLLDQGNESGHLRVVDDDDVGASRGKGSTFREPVSIGVVTDPMVHLNLFFLRQAKVGIGNT
jgi:hypothetical protein